MTVIAMLRRLRQEHHVYEVNLGFIAGCCPRKTEVGGVERDRGEGGKQNGKKRGREDPRDKIAVLTVLPLVTCSCVSVRHQQRSEPQGKSQGWMEEAAAVQKGHPMGEGLSNGKRPDNILCLALNSCVRNGTGRGPVCSEKCERVNYALPIWRPPIWLGQGQFPGSPGGVIFSIFMTRSKFPLLTIHVSQFLVGLGFQRTLTKVSYPQGLLPSSSTLPAPKLYDMVQRALEYRISVTVSG